MDEFLMEGKRKLKDKEASTSSKTPSTSRNLIIISRTRKNDQAYLIFNVTNIERIDKEKTTN